MKISTSISKDPTTVENPLAWCPQLVAVEDPLSWCPHLVAAPQVQEDAEDQAVQEADQEDLPAERARESRAKHPSKRLGRLHP